jgi:hypothetical protein
MPSERVELEKTATNIETELPSSASSTTLPEAGNRKRKTRVGYNQWVFSSVVDSPAYDEGDRSSSIVLAHDVGRIAKLPAVEDGAASPSSAPRKRTKCILYAAGLPSAN